MKTKRMNNERVFIEMSYIEIFFHITKNFDFEVYHRLIFFFLYIQEKIIGVAKLFQFPFFDGFKCCGNS